MPFFPNPSLRPCASWAGPRLSCSGHGSGVKHKNSPSMAANLMSEGDEGQREYFALYGFALGIPKEWRVEFNPKGTRAKGDVVFHAPDATKVFVSWGPLDEAKKRFKTVEDQRDWGIANLAKSRGISSVSTTEKKESVICGHRALTTRIVASVGGGLLTRKQPDQGSDSVYLHCPESSRYYVIYSVPQPSGGATGFSALFDSVAQSLVCHGFAPPVPA